MLAQYEPNVKATIVFLRTLGIKVNDVSVNETLQNHPDWPSLLCISDSLKKWNIPNAAGKIQPEEIDRLPVPFIACIHDAETPIVVVSNVFETHINYYAHRKRKSIYEEKNVFLKKWDGVYLIAESNEKSGEKNYRKVKRESNWQALIPFVFSLCLIGFSFYCLQAIFNGEVDAGVYVQYAIYMAGVVVTTLLLWYEIDRNNPLLKKVCTGISKGSCEAILTGSQAKLLGWLSWSEIGFFYFTGSLLALLFVPGVINVLALFSLLALPYILFSLYYQWRVAKRWCVLCLCVQALLLISGINILTGSFIQEPITLSAGTLITTIGCFLLPGLCWYTIKPYCVRLQQSVTTKREYLRIKFNAEIFDTLLKKQKTVTDPGAKLGISLGRTEALHTLMKVCNPYCGPCARAHHKMEKLLAMHHNLQVKIIFTAPDDDDNIMSKPVKHLLAIAERQDEELTKKALDDWYLAETKDYSVFAAQYPMNGELLVQGPKLAAMDKWCREMNVVATPTFFLDGRELPDAYSIEDLEYFLLE